MMMRPFPRRSVRVVFALAAFLICGAAPAAAAPAVQIPSAPARWATDEAGFISSSTRADIDSRLEAFERETGRQVLLYVTPTTGEMPIEDYAARAFGAWKVGRKGLDDGLVLFIFPRDRRVRIEVGYGLEGTVPDAVAGRVINNVLVPAIERGDPDGGVREAVSSLLDAISGKTASGSENPDRRASKEAGEVPPAFIIIGIIIFAILFITNPRLALWLLYTLLSGGGRGGGFGGGGGGFRGGGGRSGGGGASGGW